MPCREREMSSLTFRPVDRLPLVEWPIRRSTMDAWIEQGYPASAVPPAAPVNRLRPGPWPDYNRLRP